MRLEKIDNLFYLIRNGANIKQDKDIKGIPITRIETIANGEIDFSKMGYASILDESYHEYYLKEGDILMSHINSELHLGKVAYVEKYKNNIIHGMNLLCLKPNLHLIYPRYIYYFFKTPTFKYRINKISKKSVNQSSFTISALKELEVPVGSIYEQIKIAKILKRIEKLIFYRKETINILNQYVKSSFIKLFGNPIKNEKGWDTGTIGDLVDEVKYGTSKPANPDGKYTYLRMNNITYDGYMDYSDLKYIDITEKEIEKYTIRKGDLLFNRTNSRELVGKTGVYNQDKEMVIAGYLIRVRTNKKANPYFIWGYLNSPYGKKVLYNTSKSIVGMANINAQELQKIKIIIPPLDKQNQFAQIVEKAEEQKKHYKNSLIQLENLYKALSQLAFTGKLDLSKLDISEELKAHNEKSDTIKDETVVDKLNENIETFHYNLTHSGAPEHIDNTIRQLDTELRFKGDIPFWNDYVKYRLLPKDTAFTFTEVWEKIQKFPFETYPTYEELVKLIYEWIKEGFIKQEFDELAKDEKDRRIKLRLV